MKKLFLLTLCAVMFAYFALPAEIQAQKNKVDIDDIRNTLPKMLGANNAGKEFLFSVPPCYEVGGQGNFIKLFITSPVKTLVTVQVPGKGFYKTQYTVPNDVILFDLEPPVGQPYTKLWQEPDKPAIVYPGGAVHIKADQPLVVYCVTRYTATSDGFLALPVSSLGKEYIIAGESVDPMWTNANQSFPNVACIVGTVDQTRVSFTLGGSTTTKTADGLTPGQSMSAVINKGDVWPVSTKGAMSDLTGSKIVATKPVSVVTGNMCNNIPDGNQWCDFTVEMDLPTFTWGLDYHVPKVPGRRRPPLIRVFAKEGSTDIYRNGNHIGHVKESGGVKGRGWQEFRLHPFDWELQSAVISGNKPIGVTFYNPGVQEDGYPLPNSDPFVMAMTPYQQYQTEITFATPGIRGAQNFSENYVNLVYQLDENGTMPADCQFAEVRNGRFVWEEIREKFAGVDEEFQYKVDGKRYKVKTLDLKSDGVYKIRAKQPFAAYSFGYGWCDSYGYPTSAALADLEKPDTVCPLPIWKMTCDGVIEGATVTDRPDDPSVRSNLSMIVVDPDPERTFNFEFRYNDFTPGETVTTNWRAEVRDKKKDARITIVFMDRRGNDTTIVIDYHAVNLAIRPEVRDFGLLKTGESKDMHFWAINETEGSDVLIDKFNLKFGNQGFQILDLAPRFVIPKKDSIRFTVRFTATVEGEFKDSVSMEDTCYNTAAAFMTAKVGEPVIVVTDIDFGPQPVNTTTVRQANIRNTGSVELTITGYSGPTESVYIPQLAAITTQNPLKIQPNAPPWVFDVHFTPTEERQYPDAITFHNDATRVDSICVLNGSGIKADLLATSLEWPRLRIDRPAPRNIDPYTHPDLGIVLTNLGTQEVTITGLRVQKGDINNPVFIFNRAAFTNLVIPPGESRTFPVTFNPKAVGPHELVFRYNNTANSETETRLYGEGILPKITTTDYDFGTTIVEDYESLPSTRKIRISCDNWEWEDSVKIEDIEVVNAGTIATVGVNFANDKYEDYGTEGYLFDKTAITFPFYIQPGEFYEFDAHFIAKKTDPSNASVKTKSDAEAEVTSNWTGTGLSYGIEVDGSSTEICFGETAILSILVKNTKLGELTVKNIDFAGTKPDEINVVPADLFLFEQGFKLKPGESQLIRFSYSPGKPTGSQTVVATINVYSNAQGDDSVATATLTGTVVHFDRTTRIQVSNPKNNQTFKIKDEAVDVKVYLEAGPDFTKANVETINVEVTHAPRILQIDELTLATSQYFDIVDKNLNKINGIINVTLKVKAGQAANLKGNEIELISFKLKTYLPTDKDLTDESQIFASAETIGNSCVTIAGSVNEVAITGECVYDLRWISASGLSYIGPTVKPNPVSGNTAEMEFTIALDAHTNIGIFNSMGELVSEIANGMMRSGNYSVQLPVSTLASGTYMIKLQSGPFSESTQLVIVK